MAFYQTPHTGGTYSYYCRLKECLRPLGWDLRLVLAGRTDTWDAALETSDCAHLVPNETGPGECLKALLAWIEANEIDVWHSCCVGAGHWVLPYLPSKVRAVSSVHSLSRAYFRWAVTDRE